MSCDNIRQNGVVLEAQFLAYLYQTSQYELADWVKDNVKFPSSMVDRITPRTTHTLREEVEELFPCRGYNAIQSEEYTQWVIEDKFASDFPDLSQVGATITNDLEPYEETKIRILNGGHTALAYLGVLSGYDTFDQVMNNEVHRNHFKQLQKEEIIPSIEMELLLILMNMSKRLKKDYHLLQTMMSWKEFVWMDSQNFIHLLFQHFVYV